MIINLSPIRMDATLVVFKQGEVLTVNGKDFDLSQMPEGGSLPAYALDSPFFTGMIHREAGQLSLTLLLPHGINPSQAVAFPAPLVDPEDGELDLPRDALEGEFLPAPEAQQ